MKKAFEFLLVLLIFNFSLLVLSLSNGLTFHLNEVNAQTSTSYKIKAYEFGGGGGTSVDSSSYSLNGIVGEAGSDGLSSTSYKSYPGLTFAQNANVPPSPTFVNDTGNRYNKLKITVNKDPDDPSDAKYAIAISTDNFVADAKYLQSSTMTLGANPDFQNYTTWGGGTGVYILNLASSTTYYAKVTSTQGKYTQSGYSSVATASTTGLSIAFDIDIGGTTDPGETAPPYSIDFSNLTPGSVTTAANRAWIDFATNAESGGFVYIYDQYAGLKSNAVNYTISAVTSDLSSVSEGFGIQDASKTQSSGGPLNYSSPYNGAGNSVGAVNNTIQEIFNSSNAPITGGRGSFSLKARAKNTTPGANDYADTLTLVAAGSF